MLAYMWQNMYSAERPFVWGSEGTSSQVGGGLSWLVGAEESATFKFNEALWIITI